MLNIIERARKEIRYILFLIILVSSHSALLTAQPNHGNIQLNQLGFYVGAPKKAFVTNDSTATVFFITAVNSTDTLFTGTLGPVKHSGNSSAITRMADFSDFRSAGRYQIIVPGVGTSYPFIIGANVNHPVAVASLKGFYYIRSSIPLERQYAGKWSRPAGHPDTAVLIHASAASSRRPQGTVISTPGGWYDAGDYNKYIVNSGITMGTLLSAYEDFPSWFDTLSTNIPESKDHVPDLLNEVLYNLRWMHSMQDPEDGGVYNKCTNAAFDSMVMPGVTKAPRYVVQKGTAATLDFAAVMAQAARIFKQFQKELPGLSDSCLADANKAWRWAEQNPAMAYDQNAINRTFEPKITTGAYGDNNFKDEWFWSAVELFLTTKDNQYLTVLTQNINNTAGLPSWANVQMLGNYSLLRMEDLMPASMQNDISLVKRRLLGFVDSLTQHVRENAFQTVMGRSKRDFNWGSNSNAANQGIALINAYRLTKNKKYIDFALSNLDYILGRNATGYCFVTGIGSKSTMHPHHRPSVADGIPEPVPGLMAGGPNPGMQDHCHYDYKEPETAYADIDCAYASNEIAINWNAPLVYLSNAIEALQKDVNY